MRAWVSAACRRRTPAASRRHGRRRRRASCSSPLRVARSETQRAHTRAMTAPSAPTPSDTWLRALKGRGAASNPQGRFETIRRHAEDDGWQHALLVEEQPRPQTVVTEEHARSVITRNDSPDIGFDQAMNPYRGCEHGCIYCF